jgi:hypothetical protein
MVGITPGENARLNAACVFPPSPVYPPNPGIVTLTFYGAG